MEFMSSCRPSTSVLSFSMRENLDEIRNVLASKCGINSVHKSSHWNFQIQKFAITNNRISNIDGFGSTSKRNFITQKLHQRAQKRLLKNLFDTNSKYYASALALTKKQNRGLDYDVMRHVLTFEFLDRRKILQQVDNCCVIGDGRSNFVSLAILSSQFRKIVSVNLPEILLSDLDNLEKIVEGKGIRLAESKESLKLLLQVVETRVILVQAEQSSLLHETNMDLFVNIASFQEMNPEVVNAYFEIVQSNGSYLYCCNREKKVLKGGEVLDFFSWPWMGSRVIVDELCPWYRKFYDFRSLILYRERYFDGSVRHRLVKFD